MKIQQTDKYFVRQYEQYSAIYAAPKGTWQAYHKNVAFHLVKDAISCMTPKVREHYQQQWQQLQDNCIDDLVR